MKYAILRSIHPNLRYDASLDKLLRAEFSIITRNLFELNPVVMGGLKLHEFEGDLSSTQLCDISRLSGMMALFEIDGDSLRPKELPPSILLADSMPSILKYKGKTNETFTRLMINVAAFSSQQNPHDSLFLLDPVCGKGTTLFCALGYGYNSFGIEKDKREIDEAVTFTKSYFKFERMKHSYDKLSLTLPKGSACAHVFQTAVNAQEYKDSKKLEMKMVCADTRQAKALSQKQKYDLLVCDLPYGIQHSAQGKRGSDVLDLVKSSLEAWISVLKPGAAVAMSFNDNTLKRDDLRNALECAGLVALCGGAYDQFPHWVEQAVNRDIVVAVVR